MELGDDAFSSSGGGTTASEADEMAEEEEVGGGGGVGVAWGWGFAWIAERWVFVEKSLGVLEGLHAVRGLQMAKLCRS